MKHTFTKPTATAPKKRPAQLTPYNLSFAALAGLPTGRDAASKPAPKRAAPAVATTPKRPAPAAVRPVGPTPAPAAKPPAAAHDFSHLARVRHAGPIYTPPPAPGAAAPRESGAAIEKRLHSNLQSALPLRQQRRP